ncbi:Uncharacterised protein [Citrobacter koseri]|nr:Uncharacterised protein [Citrobacter koseri]
MVEAAIDAVKLACGRMVPKKKAIEAISGTSFAGLVTDWYPDNRIHECPPSDERANIRSATPMGFAKSSFSFECTPSQQETGGRMTPEEQKTSSRPGSSLRRRDNQSDERKAQTEVERCMPTHPSQALREGKTDGYQPGEICQCYWPDARPVWSGIMTLTKRIARSLSRPFLLLAFTFTELTDSSGSIDHEQGHYRFISNG